MKLALGTVQFGLRYGVAGRGEIVPEAEVRDILACAEALGIRMLDTAAAYGDIEERLVGLVQSHPKFRIVTKLPPIPAGTTPAGAERWVDATLERAFQRLGDRLHAVLFHRAEDLLEGCAVALWERSSAWSARRSIPLGVSAYDVATLDLVRRRFPVTIAQLPGNALDQRLLRQPSSAPPGFEIHLRSAFLQGLLLMPEEDAARRVPRAAAALTTWHAWCRSQQLEPLVAALGLVKGLPGVSHCVVGVDRLTQLEAIAAAWQAAPVLHGDMLHTDDLEIIDPRRWPAPH